MKPSLRAGPGRGASPRGFVRVSRHKRPVIALQVDNHYTRLKHGIVDDAREREWQLVDLELCGGVLPAGIDFHGGLLDLPPDSRLVRELRRAGRPVVRVGRLPDPADSRLPAVVRDEGAVGALAAEHFAERGFRDVAYVGRDPWHVMKPLYEGFHDRALALGIRCHLLRFKSFRRLPESERYRRRQAQFTDWLRKMPMPLGVFSWGDTSAARVCFMAARSGFSVPAQVAVLGRGNNIGPCECSLPQLSSVDLNDEARGREACGLLARLMAGDAAPDRAVLFPPAGVVTRQSTDLLAASDPRVAEALRYLWDHLDEDLPVKEVARAVRMAPRSLQRAFRKDFNRGVNAERVRKRLERCRELLRSTDLTVAAIAPLVGFRSKDYLHAAFRRTFGTTPRKYRLAARQGQET